MKANFSTLWLAEAHAAAAARIDATADRLILRRAQLDLVDAAGRPSFVLTHQTGLKIPATLVAAYRKELAAVLQQAAEALEQATAAPICTELAATWHAALQRLPLPSTRLMLHQQARLTELDEHRAVVAVDGHWLSMAASRADEIEHAIGEALGRSVALTLVAAAGEVAA